MNLLTTNPKVEKGESVGVATYILHLAPSWLSGYNVCPAASPGCATACLNCAGRGGIPDGTGAAVVSGMVGGERLTWTVKLNNIQRARIRKTKLFFEDRGKFFALLVGDIESGIRAARRKGLTPAFRLNGTSDIRFELYPVERNGERFRNIFDAFPNVQFYDYTKIPNRRNIPGNYHLTFSLSESNDREAIDMLRRGYSVAVPLWLKRGGAMPETWGGFPVTDGDVTDVRFTDPRGVIVGLRVKGRVDPSNAFVRDPNGGFRVARALPVVKVA